MKFKITLTLMLLSFGTLASDNVDNACNTKHGGVSAGAICVSQKIKVVDDNLNQSYNSAIARIESESPELKELFINAQRAWLDFKDSECEFIGSSFTSSPWKSVQIEECKLQMMKERVKYLDTVFVG